MSDHIAEADWKVFKEIHEIASERYAHGSVAAIKRVVAAPGKTDHERFNDVFDLVTRRRKEAAGMFDDFRRSTAVVYLGLIRSKGLVTDKEMARFSEDLQSWVARVVGWRRTEEAPGRDEAQ